MKKGYLARGAAVLALSFLPLACKSKSSGGGSTDGGTDAGSSGTGGKSSGTGGTGGKSGTGGTGGTSGTGGKGGTGGGGGAGGSGGSAPTIKITKPANNATVTATMASPD